MFGIGTLFYGMSIQLTLKLITGEALVRWIGYKLKILTYIYIIIYFFKFSFLFLIWTTAALFFINGIAVLSEDRFLARIGWSSKNSSTTSSNIQSQYGYGDFNNGNNSLGSGGEGIKARLVNLISATRTLLRIPLIIVNILVIIYELVLG